MENPLSVREKRCVLVTSFGSDRPGIVDDLAAWFLEHGGNIEESRMARLGSDFAALVLVSGPADLFAQLSSTRESFEKRANLSVVLKPAAPLAPTADPVLRYRLEAMALDHPGIVQRIAHVLRSYGVSIAEAVTHLEQAPFTSAPVFRVAMEIDVPASAPTARLRSDLQKAAEADGVDVVLRPA
ncbi:MAG: hypothetical protein N2Z21_05560 [Candidatus Sumerlaeaceae bacterium]|nr:hypothetical protein [Candidatus Sumerlaeaceae bacterium]